MNYKFISDTHIHSDISYDALDPTIKLCEYATQIGLYSITITDQCNCNEYSIKNSRRAIRQSFFLTKKAQNVFKDSINVFTGIELGQPVHNERAADDALLQSDFDFVLAGNYKLKDSDNFEKITFTNNNANTVLLKYLDEIIELIDWGEFDSLAHLTYPFKFIYNHPEIKIDNISISEKLNIIIEKLSEKQKALEVDEYMLEVPKDNFLSANNILTTFKKAGGKYITLGSNAHSYKNIGHGINKGLHTALDVGFTHFSLFKNRVPYLLPIN